MTRHDTGERVLIVEDDALVAEMIQEWVEREGYQVAGVVYDGQSAVDSVQRIRPDVIVMDLQMPGMDGVEATRRIQQVCPTPVIVLTAHDDVALAQTAAAVGAAAYLVKPSSGRELARAIAFVRRGFVEEMAMRTLVGDLTAQVEDLGTFAHAVAHDLRNALTPVLGIAQLLSEDLESTPLHEARRQLDIIANKGRQLRLMIDEMLMFAEVRERDLVPSPLEMGALLAEAQDRLSDSILALGAQITTPASWPPVLGHGSWVVEVWVNYLSNALKYGGRPPWIEVGYSEQPGERANETTHQPARPPFIRFTVRDNGAGLTAEQQSRLFQPFVQLHPTLAQGHGLGLSIVRRIVAKLGGDVGVDSQLGQGSAFWFTLPAAPG